MSGSGRPGALHRLAEGLIPWVMALTIAWGACDGPRPGAARPNVLLVTVDTLRADAVSAYGAAEATTPVIDALAERGVRFRRAYAPSTWTAPSVASLLTSLEPDTHGVTRGRGRFFGATGQRVLSSRALTWAEALRAQGYRTHAVVTNGHLVAELGFAQGFDTYTHLDEDSLGWEDDGYAISRAVLERRAMLRRGETPWFLWVHYYDPHQNYEPRAPWSEAPDFEARWAACGDFEGRVGHRNAALPHWLDCARAAYATEVKAADDAIGRVLEGLGVSDDDLVVVTADHGEEFREHGGMQHGLTLYDEVSRVPLVIAFPGRWRAGTVVEAPVSLVDVLPTVLDHLAATPSVHHQGVSLSGLIEGSEAGRPVILSVARTRRARATGIVAGRWKLIRHADGRGPELYDLRGDPGERRNLSEREVEVAAALEQTLTSTLRKLRRQRLPEEAVRTFAPEEIERLEAMGYVE